MPAAPSKEPIALLLLLLLLDLRPAALLMPLPWLQQAAFEAWLQLAAMR
jgi:hypothetical protein